jgi:hypothetical protein
MPYVPTPAVLGHEVAGIVAKVGPDVAQFRVGDHVVGSLAQSCGMCARCLSGRLFQCQHPESTLRRPADAPRLTRNGIGLFQGMGLGGFPRWATRPTRTAPIVATRRVRWRHLPRTLTLMVLPDLVIRPDDLGRAMVDVSVRETADRLTARTMHA